MNPYINKFLIACVTGVLISDGVSTEDVTRPVFPKKEGGAQSSYTHNDKPPTSPLS